MRAYEKGRQVLTSTPDIGGVYVSAVNPIPVLRAIDVGLAGLEAGRTHRCAGVSDAAKD